MERTRFRRSLRTMMVGRKIGDQKDDPRTALQNQPQHVARAAGHVRHGVQQRHGKKDAIELTEDKPAHGAAGGRGR
jgi:hypothetical protein